MEAVMLARLLNSYQRDLPLLIKRARKLVKAFRECQRGYQYLPSVVFEFEREKSLDLSAARSKILAVAKQFGLIT